MAKAVRRDPERTKRNILAAAVIEFTAKGLAGARVDAIATRAKANKRMIYAYFGNKEALWLAALESVYARMREEERSLSVAAMSPEEGMAALMRFNFRFCHEHPEFITLLNSENLHKARYLKQSKRMRELYSPLLSMIDDLLRRGQASGAFRDGIDATDLYIIIAALGFFPNSNAHTLSTIFERDLKSTKALREQERQLVEVVLGYLRR
jgi:TetR/AcrR family transcriptional regulator